MCTACVYLIICLFGHLCFGLIKFLVDLLICLSRRLLNVVSTGLEQVIDMAWFLLPGSAK